VLLVAFKRPTASADMGPGTPSGVDVFAPPATQLTDPYVKSPKDGLESAAFGLTSSTSAVGGVQRINDLWT